MNNTSTHHLPTRKESTGRISLIGAVSLLLTAFAISPALSTPLYYIGMDVAGVHLDTVSPQTLAKDPSNFGDMRADRLYSANVHFGVRLGNIGSELGYTTTLPTTKTNVFFSDPLFRDKTSLQTTSFDFLGYVPLTKGKELELIGSAGFTNTTLTYDAGFASSFTKKERKLRLGLGFQYALAETLHIRLMARWQDANFDAVANNIISISLGFHYNF